MSKKLTRRGALNMIAITGATIITGCQTTQPEKNPKTSDQPSSDGSNSGSGPYVKWGSLKNSALVPAAGKNQSENNSGNVFTILFDSLRVELNENDEALSRINLAAFEVPVSIPAGKHFIGFSTDVRGSVTKGESAKISIFLDLGGAARLIEFIPGTQAVDMALEEALVRKQAFPPDEQVSEDHPAPPYRGNLFISVERFTKMNQIIVQIDSLDITALLV